MVNHYNIAGHDDENTPQVTLIWLLNSQKKPQLSYLNGLVIV